MLRGWIGLVALAVACATPRTLREVESHVAHQDWSAAHAALDVGLAQKPGHAKLLNGVRFVETLQEAEEHVRQWRFEQALELFRRAEVLMPGVPYVSDQTRHARALLEAEQAVSRQEWQRARGAVAQAGMAWPRSAQVPVLVSQLDGVARARLALEAERWGAAAEIYASLTDRPVGEFAERRGRLVVHLRTAAQLLDREDWQGASNASFQAAKVERTPQVERFKAHVVAMRGADEHLVAFAWKPALDELSKADATRPGAPYVASRRALAKPMAQAERLISKERYDDAVVRLNKAREVAPRHAHVDVRLRYATSMGQGTLAVTTQDWRGAQQRYSDALRIVPGDRAAQRQIAYVGALSRADSFIDRRRWSSAIEQINEALALRPSDPFATRMLGFSTHVEAGSTHERARDWRSALASYQKAEKMMAGHPYVLERMRTVQEAAVQGALKTAVDHGKAGRFGLAFDELRFAEGNGATGAPLQAARALVSGQLEMSVADRIRRRDIAAGYELVVLGQRELGSKAPWLRASLERLRGMQRDLAWALVERGEPERGIEALGLIERFEPDQARAIAEERLRMHVAWGEGITSAGLSSRDYAAALTELDQVLGHHEALRGDLQRLGDQLRVAWASQVRADAEAQHRMHHLGAAAVLTARAVEIAGIHEDRDHLASLLQRLKRRGHLWIDVSTTGDPTRTAPVRARIVQTLRDVKGLGQVSSHRGGRAHHFTVVLAASESRCEESTEVVPVEIKDDLGAVVHTYDLQRVTRTCKATLSLSFEGHGSEVHRLVGTASTSDDTHDAVVDHGVSADPLRFTVDDATLIRDVDASHLDKVSELISDEVHGWWHDRLSHEMEHLRRAPDDAIGPLIGLWLVRSDLFSAHQKRDLEHVMRDRYGLQNARTVLR
ncbi:MAG: tetratricopeptide (TPR) repeat protein [Kiritimatiellia bacterium]|jgi:tetratricopeptide (TPR) repeat protein